MWAARPVGGRMCVEGLSELLGLIYDTALDPSTWPVVLDRLADLLGAIAGAAMVSYNSSTRMPTILYPRGDKEHTRRFLEDWCHRAPILGYGRGHPAVIKPECFVSRQEYCRREIFNEWLKRQREDAMIGAKLFVEGPVSTFLGLLRPY